MPHPCSKVPTRLALTLLGALALSTAAHHASAAAAPEVPTAVVRYEDLNLDRAHDAQTLYRRLLAAAQQVCPQLSLGNRGAQMRSRDCQREAITRAARQIDSPQMALVLAAHFGRS